MNQAITGARYFALINGVLLLAAVASAQEVPSILQVEVENYVSYVGDTTDPSKVARSSGTVTPNAPLNFFSNVILADVTKINGAPAKGTLVIRSQTMLLTPTPNAGGAIADVTRPAMAEVSWEFLKPDGSSIGNMYVMGFSGGTPPPGSPQGSTGGAAAIVGGTGSFLGARGTMNNVEILSPRTTSQAEDPSARRTNGGGRARFVFQVLPVFRPEVVVGADGPEIFHADERPVTADSPAKAGEELILNAKGLGPTRPDVSLGAPFPSDPPAVPSAPIEVLVNDKSSAAVDAVGRPGASGTYRVRFRVPDDAPAGNVTVQLSAAWMKGSAATIQVQ